MSCRNHGTNVIESCISITEDDFQVCAPLDCYFGDQRVTVPLVACGYRQVLESILDWYLTP